MSFRDDSQGKLDFSVDPPGLFRDDVSRILVGAMQAPEAEIRIIHGDARALDKLNDRFDLVITSPPYANRMSYIALDFGRALRTRGIPPLRPAVHKTESGRRRRLYGKSESRVA